MRIQRATIYGFGKWVDYSIDFTQNPLVCIFGENESGKSTIQQFILFMLFGLPPKQRTFYQPKTSGKMGGQLTLHDRINGEYTVERMDGSHNGAATCYLSDGREVGEEWLKDQLKGMTKEIYESIFSFSAMDLDNLKHMKESDFGEALLSIGLTGSNNIHTLEKQLDARLGALFKPTGKVPTINKQLDKLDSLFNELSRSKSNEGKYRETHAELIVLEQEVDMLQQEARNNEESLVMIEKQQQGLPLINEYQQLNSQLGNYATDIPFPESGVRRLESLKEKLLPLKSECSILKSAIENNQAKYDTLQAGLKDEHMYSSANEIINKKQHYLINKQHLQKHEETISQLELRMELMLNELQIGLTNEALSVISLPYHIENVWNQLKNSIEQLKLEKEQVKQEISTLNNQQAMLHKQIKETEQQLLPDEKIRELQTIINMQMESEYIQKAKAESEKTKRQWSNTQKQKIKSMNQIFMISIFVGLITGIVAFFIDQPFLYVVMGFVLVLGIAQRISGKQSLQTMEQLLHHKHTDDTPSFNISAEEVHETKQLLDNQSKLINSITIDNESLKAVELQLMRWTDRENRLKQQEIQIDEQIEVQHLNYPFLQHIEVTYWPEFYHTIKDLLKLENEKQELKTLCNELKRKTSTYEEEVNQFFANENSEVMNNTIEHKLELIETFIQEGEKSTILLDQYKKVIDENNEQLAQMRKSMNVYEEEINILFNIANVENDNAFYERANELEEKKTILATIKRIKTQLMTIFTKDILEEIINKQLDQGKLEIEYEKALEKGKQTEEMLHKKRQLIAHVNANLMQMEGSDVYSDTLHHFTMEQEQLSNLAKEWAVLKTAKETLVETKRIYQKKYLSMVIDKTAHYFKEITGNRYKTVYAPSKANGFQVVGHDEIRYEVNELSKGTLDQLYISLRIAISEIMSEKHHLPFIVDDAFLNFDATRLKRMMEIIAEIADRQQMIIFTCKQEVVDSLAGPSIIDLNIKISRTP